MLRESVSDWNDWRLRYPDVQPDLSEADLSTGFTQPDFRGADLTYARLSRADLGEAMLIDARLTGADLAYANLNATPLLRADMASADLMGASLDSTMLSRANLTGANLFGAELIQTVCRHGTDFTGATLAAWPWHTRSPRGEISLFPLVSRTCTGLWQPPGSASG